MNACGFNVAPFWRAVAGAFFGAIVGGVWLVKGFWAALLILAFIVLGALVGVFAAGSDE